MTLIENETKDLFFHFQYVDHVGDLDTVAQGPTLTIIPLPPYFNPKSPNPKSGPKPNPKSGPKPNPSTN